MKTIKALGREWPDTGRTIAEHDTLGTGHIHAPWDDLLKYDSKRGVWVYISTLPHQQNPKT